LRDLYPDPKANRRAKLSRWMLATDAWVDTSLFSAGRWARELFERFSAFMDRFHVSGWRRWLLVEPASEAATLGGAGLVLMLALAMPAFQETTDDGWLRGADIAVTFLDRYGNEVGTRGARRNESVPLEEFPDHLIRATLATEDRRFYEHFGIDFAGTFRAMMVNARAGGVVQGGSSISQQLAKNLFLSNERTVERKVKEAFLALWLETRLTKNEILKLYLDRAYLGGGAFGVEAAAQFYFNKSVKDVTLAESAMLAGLFKAPARFAPHVNLPAARARANVVLDNLVEAGFLTEGQVFGARRNPATAMDRRDERSPNYYLDWAYEETRRLVDSFPKSVTDRTFIVRTALDQGLQNAADMAVENSLRQYGPDYNVRQAAAVIADHDGAVRALVGGRDYGASQFNRAVHALRQPGSSFKPYVYTAALMHGLKPTSPIVDAPICLGNWCPQNYNRSYAGRINLLTAITRSINTVPVRLSLTIGKGNAREGRKTIVKLARDFGLTTPLVDTPSLPIGAGEVNVLEHTVAFATFPNEGRAVRPHAILDVRNATGDVIWRYDRNGPKPRQIIPKQVAHDMSAMLVSAAERGTARRATLNGVRIAGKTGTTNAHRDGWFVGFTGNYVGGIWFGNDDYEPMRRLTGGSLPAMTWQAIMTYAHQGIELRNIPGAEPNPPAVDKPQLGAVAIAASKEVGPRPTLLSRRGADALVRIERLMDETTRALAVADPSDRHSARTTAGPFAAARGAGAPVRGN